MPLDPSIVSNAFANIAMPDMNALMQQRVRGAENIYQIETARQAQAAEAEKEAAKAQEAATIKALLPAYTYGIQTGDIAGVGNLVSPELRPQLQQYIDALAGKSPQEVQAALIGSLSASPAGQEALAAIQRGQTAQIQMGQLDVSRERLAFDKSKIGAAPAADYVTVPTDQGLYILNKKTGEYKLMQPGETGIPGPRAEPETGGAPVEAPISTAAPPQPNVLKPPPKTTGVQITQGERRAASLLDNVVRNAGAVNKVITEKPEAFQPTAVEAASGFLPWGERQAAAWQQTPERKIVYNRMLQSIDALLTLATGAAYTKPQLEAQLGAYLPGFFDEDVVKRDKVLALRDRIESEKINAGRAWTPEQDAKAEEVFRQFETLAETMSQGVSAEGAGEVDTSNPLLKDEE